MCRGLTNMIFPNPCLLCQGPKTVWESFICTPCLIALPRELNQKGQCERLAMKLWGLIPVDNTFAYLKFRKSNRVQELMHILKYRHTPELGYQLGIWFASEMILPLSLDFHRIVPVPLHPQRHRRRGYNQSLSLALGISSCSSWQVTDCLFRKSAANTQTELNKWHRFENTELQFGIATTLELKDQKVLLVDDIVTTGATMVACALPLVAAGAKVSVAAAALTQAH